jgi:phage terminase large subunit-like protein
VIRQEWLRYYEMQGEIMRPLDSYGKPIDSCDCREFTRYATIDTAGTSQQKADEKKGKPASWSVCQIWEYWPKTKYLFLRHQWRQRVSWDGLKAGIRATLQQWKPSRVLIENAHFGPALVDELKGYHVELVSPIPARARGDEGRPGKLERATDLINKLEHGEVFLPKHNNSWLTPLEAEWLSWTGLADETADQIDAAAYAARHAHEGAGFCCGGIVYPPHIPLKTGGLGFWL